MQQTQEKKKYHSAENIHHKETKHGHIVRLDIENNTESRRSCNREGQEDEKDEVRTDSFLSFLMGLSEEILIDDIVNQCDEEELIEPSMDIFSIADPKCSECRLIDEPRIANLESDEDEIDEIEPAENDIVIDLINLEYDDRPRMRMIFGLSEGSMNRDKNEKYSTNCDHPCEYIEDISPEKYRIKKVRKEFLKHHIRRNEERNDDDTEKEKYPNSLQYDATLLSSCYYLSSPIEEISSSSTEFPHDRLEDIGNNSEVIEEDPCEFLEGIPHENEQEDIDTEQEGEKHKGKKSVREERKPAREDERENCEKYGMFPGM